MYDIWSIDLYTAFDNLLTFFFGVQDEYSVTRFISHEQKSSYHDLTNYGI
ncbi:MAG: hypothetical protein ACREBS_05680 [Nitrososphaerales archaeon]